MDAQWAIVQNLRKSYVRLKNTTEGIKYHVEDVINVVRTLGYSAPRGDSDILKSHCCDFDGHLVLESEFDGFRIDVTLPRVDDYQIYMIPRQIVFHGWRMRIRRLIKSCGTHFGKYGGLVIMCSVAAVITLVMAKIHRRWQWIVLAGILICIGVYAARAGAMPWCVQCMGRSEIDGVISKCMYSANAHDAYVSAILANIDKWKTQFIGISEYFPNLLSITNHSSLNPSMKNACRSECDRVDRLFRSIGGEFKSALAGWTVNANVRAKSDDIFARLSRACRSGKLREIRIANAEWEILRSCFPADRELFDYVMNPNSGQ